MLVLLLLGCSASSIGLVGADPEPRDRPAREDTAADTDPEVLDSAPGFDTAATEEAAPPFDDSDLAGWVFTLDRIHTVAITLTAASEAALTAEPYVWATGSVAIDDVPMENVGVRLRGKIGSFRSLGAKPKFKIAFNEFVDDQRFYGMEELSLNNAVVDCSYMKEVVGWKLYEAAGVPHLRTSYARVTVNGADYGLYVMLETPDDAWLKRHFANPDGNLYDGKYVYYGGYSYTLLDFGNGVDELYQLEEGTDVGNADIASISAALLASQGTADFHDTVGAILDWDAFHRMTAVDQFLGHNDGYSMNTNNYRVYFDPDDGKADLLPWDLDYTFLYDYQWGLSWRAPSGNLTYACFQDTSCLMEQRAAMQTFLTAYEAIDWTTFLSQIESLTWSQTQTDPRRECAAADVVPNRDYVRAWLAQRPAEMRSYWGL